MNSVKRLNSLPRWKEYWKRFSTLSTNTCSLLVGPPILAVFMFSLSDTGIQLTLQKAFLCDETVKAFYLLRSWMQTL